MSIEFKRDAEYAKVSAIQDQIMRQNRGIGLYSDSYGIWIADTDSSRVKIQFIEPLIKSLKESGAIDDETRDMMLNDLNFPITNDQIKTMLADTVAKQGIVEAKRKANEWVSKYELNDSLLILAQHLNEIQEYQEAMDVYQDIPENHPRYKEAMSDTKEIMLKLLQAHQDKKRDLKPEEVRNYKEALFRFELEAKDTRSATQLFFELCGLPMRSDFPEVTLTSDSLVAITSIIHNRISALEKTVKEKSTAKSMLFPEIATSKEASPESSSAEAVSSIDTKKPK